MERSSAGVAGTENGSVYHDEGTKSILTTRTAYIHCLAVTLILVVLAFKHNPTVLHT